ncbi:MAG TPA: hypothetical protein PKH25_08725 [Syntrophales bacterium]|nr:hypothetical protein [Syntrophales bacterium]
MPEEITKRGIDSPIEKTKGGETEVFEPPQRTSPFIRFHYSYREIASVNGQTRIRSKEKRFADGRLESEEFEGTLGGHVYDNVVSGMQRQFLRQMEAFLKPFSMLLPFGPRDRKDGEK